MVTGIDRFYEEAAYLAALMEYLICHKSDHEADAEIAEILERKPYMLPIIINVMEKT
jgi:hypothetical protein